MHFGLISINYDWSKKVPNTYCFYIFQLFLSFALLIQQITIQIFIVVSCFLRSVPRFPQIPQNFHSFQSMLHEISTDFIQCSTRYPQIAENFYKISTNFSNFPQIQGNSREISTDSIQYSMRFPQIAENSNGLQQYHGRFHEIFTNSSQTSTRFLHIPVNVPQFSEVYTDSSKIS